MYTPSKVNYFCVFVHTHVCTRMRNTRTEVSQLCSFLSLLLTTAKVSSSTSSTEAFLSSISNDCDSHLSRSSVQQEAHVIYLMESLSSHLTPGRGHLQQCSSDNPSSLIDSSPQLPPRFLHPSHLSCFWLIRMSQYSQEGGLYNSCSQ